MVLDTSVVRFLEHGQCMVAQRNPCVTYLTVFQTEIRHTSHGRGFPLRQVLIHLIDALRNMVVCLVEQVASIAMSEQDPRKEAGPLPPLLHVIELLSSSLRVLPRFVGFPLRLSEFVLDVVEAVDC